MHVEIPKSERDRDIEAVKRAIDRKKSEVEAADRKASELRAELRGLMIALDTIEGKPTPRVA